MLGAFINVVARVYDENIPRPPDPPGPTPIEQARYRDALKRYIEKTPTNVLKRYTNAFVEALRRFALTLPPLAIQTAHEGGGS